MTFLLEAPLTNIPSVCGGSPELRFLERMYGKAYYINSRKERDISMRIYFQSADVDIDFHQKQMLVEGDITIDGVSHHIEKGVVLFGGTNKKTFIQYHFKTSDFYLQGEKHFQKDSIGDPYKMWKDVSSIFFEIQDHEESVLALGRMAIFEPEYPIDQIVLVESQSPLIFVQWFHFLLKNIISGYNSVL